MSSQRRNPETPAFEIPDLDLPPAPRRSHSALAAVQVPEPPVSGPAVSRQSPSPISGTLANTSSQAQSTQSSGHARNGFGAPTSTKTPFDTQADDDLPSPQFDLDLSAPISHASAASVFPYVGGGLLSELPGLDLAKLTVAPGGRVNYPTGVTPDRARIVLDYNEIKALSRFGTAPSLGLLTPLYAIRVTLARRALSARLHQVEGKLAQAERKRDALLAELGRDKRAELASSRYAVRPAEPNELESRGQPQLPTSSDQATHMAEVTRLRSELEQRKKQCDREQQSALELAADSAALEQTKQRLDARYKRCFIDMRAVPADSVQRAALEQQALALHGELQAAAKSHAAAEEQRRLAVSAARRADERVQELQRELQQLERRLDPKRELNSPKVAASSSELAELGRAVLSARGGIPVETSVLEKLLRADQEVADWVKQSELHLRAFDICDDQKVRTGWLWLSLLVALPAMYLAKLALF